MANASSEMPEYKKRNTFTSYVAPLPGDINALAHTNEWCVPSDMRDVHLAKPRLLSTELIVASAPAYMYNAIAPIDIEGKPGANKDAVFGLLSVTNFKLAFVPLSKNKQNTITVNAHCQQSNVISYQENLLLQHNEVTLNNVDHVYTIAETSRAASALNVGINKRKKLDTQQKTVSGRIAALHIVCKNFRLLKFAFQQQDSKSSGARDYGKLIASALAHFAYPSRHDLSFAYCYREPYYSTLAKTSVTMYSTKNDWARELIRCGATEWQVISAASVPQLQSKLNAGKYTLPPHFVIPKSCPIERFLDLSRAFCDSRAAFWVYSYGSASLVRLAELKPAAQQDTKWENVTLELVRKSDERRHLKLMQLTDQLPNVHDVQRAYLKFRRLCTPETPEQFLVQDAKFLTLLEKTNWLLYVSVCLRYANEAAETLRKSITCVVQETNGRDMCCVITSLTQIILDPLYRTIDGFQSLIQKEWVALEHPFQRRLGHVRRAAHTDNSPDEDESPVFLLFLDCVWQLLQQYPEEFEYSQTYLTTLWDACFMPIFDTFQFDCEEDRARAVRDAQLILRPVWDWSEQFAEKDKVFFTNPFYQRQRYDAQQCTAMHMRRSIAVSTAISIPLLRGPQMIGMAATANAATAAGTAAKTAASGASAAAAAKTTTTSTGIIAASARYTINPQLFVTQSTVPKDRYLEPQSRISELAIWEQCYYRWLPVLEIKHGGFPQIELQQRMLLSNISKLQRAIDLNEFDDLPDVYYELSGDIKPSGVQRAINNATTVETLNTKPSDGSDKQEPEPEVEYVDGVERRRKIVPLNNGYKLTETATATAAIVSNCNMPTVSSFFPFGSGCSNASEQLFDILSNSNDLLLEGSSIMDKLSIT